MASENNSKDVSANGMAGRARPDIVAMKGYASARTLVAEGEETIFLDANECSFEPFIGAEDLARYPMQQPAALVRAFCDLLDVSSRNLTLTRGADEAIDCLVRAFCVPAADNIVICPPTFAMYAQSAMLQGIESRVALLDNSFDLDVKKVIQESDKNTKIIFICSPNNPTGNSMSRERIIALCEAFAGRALVVVDETYIDYSVAASLIDAMEKHANLVVLRTLSKSHAAAGVRLGAAVARQDVTALMGKVLAPYPISQPVIQAAMAIMLPDNLKRLAAKREDMLSRRDVFATALRTLDNVISVFPSDANYLLVKVADADELCARAGDSGIILRNQSHQPGLAGCVRISIGSDDDMARLLACMKGETLAARRNDRVASKVRHTSETAISVAVNLDQKGPVFIHTGVGFYDHMLEQISKHAGFALSLECDGDLHIDPHHTIEDCAIALGAALREALGDKRGIGRYGFCLPMDEALVTVALDLSGRYFLDFKADFPADHVGDLPTDMVEHIFRSLAENMQANLHIKVTGDNAHHMVEACFKGFARALRQAIRQDGADLPSTKGML